MWVRLIEDLIFSTSAVLHHELHKYLDDSHNQSKQVLCISLVFLATVTKK